jgi:oxygen-dependent protoporphyrinogen oxidase
MTTKTKKALIIGGGISGLASAYALQKAQHQVTVLEKEAYIGGVIRSEMNQSFLIEKGPHSMRLSTPFLENLIQELNLQGDIICPNSKAVDRFIVRNNQLQALPRSPKAALTTPILSFKAKLRLFLEPLIRPTCITESTSIGELITKRLGKECADYLLDPFVAGIYSGDPHTLSAKYAFKNVTALLDKHQTFFKAAWSKFKNRKEITFKPKIISFKSGMQQLPEALHQKLDQPAVLNATIVSITYQAPYWRVQWNCKGIQNTQDYDRLVIAIPAHQLATLPFKDTELLNHFKTLSELPYAGVGTLTLGFEKPAKKDALDGFGFLVPQKETGITMLGCLFDSSMFLNRASSDHISLTAFIGGSRHPRTLKSNLADIQVEVLQDLNILLDINQIPIFQQYTHWQHAIPQYTTQHGMYLKTMESIETAHPTLNLVGSYRNGISVGECIENAYTTIESLAQSK